MRLLLWFLIMIVNHYYSLNFYWSCSFSWVKISWGERCVCFHPPNLLTMCALFICYHKYGDVWEDPFPFIFLKIQKTMKIESVQNNYIKKKPQTSNIRKIETVLINELFHKIAFTFISSYILLHLWRAKKNPRLKI